MGFHRVPQFERLVVFTMTGKYGGIRGPGFVYIPPGYKVVERIDLREIVKDMPDQHCITRDNVVVTIDPIVFYKVVDPEKKVLSIQNAEEGIRNVARTTLRAVVGDMEFADVIAKREQIAAQLKVRLAEEAGRWGIDVTTVEIAEVKTDRIVEEAMARRKAEIEQAEAERRATILKAEAEKEAAQAEREALLIRAEAEKNAAIAKAEGEKQAQILHAEGISIYYQKLAELGQGAETALRFESIAALKKFGESENAKLVIIPSEMRGLTSGELGGLAQLRWAEAGIPEKPEKKE
ncbi:MAG TPA: paraslipin [Dehalococcoidia bacterium]|nr:paraslipin [Dehalococcoidia bacterium]